MVAPPSLSGGEKFTVTWALPAVAVPMIGAPGTVAGAVGVTLLDDADGLLLPCALVAITVQLTLTPLGRPVTVNGGPAPVALWLPQVAVKAVIAEPPMLAGAWKFTVT